jgi:tryptophan synthase alpha chain
MNLLDTTLTRLEAEHRVGLMAHLVAGYRSLEESREVAIGLARNGADILEIQIPFSDPTADGPVITTACQRALAGGATPRAALDLAGEVVAACGVPVLMMSYYNLLFRWPGGLAAFVADAAARGVAGTIVPDIPPEEAEDAYYDRCRGAGLHPVVLVSPNVPEARFRELKPYASGLVYATARVGTTGAASDLDAEAVRDFLRSVHRTFELPVAVGFGIGSREQIDSLAGAAQIAAVGTRLLRTLEAQGVSGLIEEVRQLAG